MVPPRVFVVSGEQWPRALLRAELRNAGYDAIGASALGRVLRRRSESDRGPVRLFVVDHAAIAHEPTALAQLRQRYPGARVVLVHPAGAPPDGAWDTALARPVSIGEIVAAVRRLVPPPEGGPAQDATSPPPVEGV